MATLGGVHDAKGIENSVEIEELARFAVEEQNKKANTLLEFVRVVKVKEQVVSGIIYYITIEAIDGGEKKLYEAKVWVKPWMKFKELQEFIPLDDCSSEIEAPKDGHENGWLMVPTNDPIIQDAAIHAVQSIQQMSNSLIPYKLLEVLSARAKKTEDSARFELLLKVARGQREEKFMVEVDKTMQGIFHLNQMRQQDSDSGIH
ncbi:cysteine proteinase inhibitor 12 isoform X1 [Elaeis guineensis]|uniref:Cysteine proteinase inhibitor n=1 Tax=Elaeis guineensis var. tenera TaxID=51953 RepID=A0A6I9RSV1_ELAGV|nr:cysteine proteinase inhibitor 12 [Elaeis guineensis]